MNVTNRSHIYSSDQHVLTRNYLVPILSSDWWECDNILSLLPWYILCIISNNLYNNLCIVSTYSLFPALIFYYGCYHLVLHLFKTLFALLQIWCPTLYASLRPLHENDDPTVSTGHKSSLRCSDTTYLKLLNWWIALVSPPLHGICVLHPRYNGTFIPQCRVDINKVVHTVSTCCPDRLEEYDVILLTAARRWCMGGGNRL